MCVINCSNTKYEVSAMYFKFGRLLVLFLNVALLLIIFMILTEFHGVIIFRDGNYTEWSQFTECTVSCGGGVMHRVRTCTNPEPTLGGRPCNLIGPPTEVHKCNDDPCPINGGFEQWSKFRKCNASCGGGVQKRIRNCIEPVPKYGGLNCYLLNLGAYEEEVPCNVHTCSVDGGYMQWSDWSACSVNCGKGTQERTRTCTNPAPLSGGIDCSSIGSAKETKECNSKCPIDGKYGEWTQWSKCSKECDGGWHTRTRLCDSPSPSDSGKTCLEMGYGNSEDTKPCNTEPCNQDGGYSNWSEWSTCSKTCGEGIKERRRICNNPKPVGSGKTCRQQGVGKAVDADECNTDPC